MEPDFYDTDINIYVDPYNSQAENQLGQKRNGTHQLLAYADDVNLLEIKYIL
jgi:hypothetical protein